MIAITAISLLGCPASDSDLRSQRKAPASATIDSAVPAPKSLWYQRTRALDLTGDGVADSARIDVAGTQTDSLRVTLVLIVNGAEKYREQWGSSDELTLVDSAARSGPRATHFFWCSWTLSSRACVSNASMHLASD